MDFTADLRRRNAHAWRNTRLAILGALGAVAILAAVGYRQFWLARPVGSGPAGPAVNRQLYDERWSDRKVLLLGLGDSVTVGYGAPAGYGYFDRLVANPPGEWPEMQGICMSKVLPRLTTLNLSRSASTSLEHINSQLPRLERQGDDVFGIVVMTTGGNDIIHSYGRAPPREGAMYGATLAQAQPWIDNFDVRLGKMLDALDAAFPGGCQIFLANIYDPTDGVGDASNAGLPHWPEGLKVHTAYNDVIARHAGERDNVHLVDMRGEFLGHGIHCLQPWREFHRAEDPTYWYYDNLEDPNIRGYDAIRRLFLNEMARVLPALLHGSDEQNQKPR